MSQQQTAGESTGSAQGALSDDELARFAKEFGAQTHNRLMQNAVSRQPVTEVALDRSIVTSLDPTVSHRLTDRKVTNQKKSGRCWLFAGLNLLRTGAAEKMGVKNFEFSQNHLLFWDKLEKANFFLEAMIATADRDVDDRTVAHLLETPAEDGGQWNMFVALVRRHGLVPQSVMPETESSSNTRLMNHVLSEVLRKAARDLRQQRADGVSAERLRATKEQVLEVVHRVLSIHLGTPPTEFLWQWHDEEKTFHRDGTLTPLEFAERYVTVPLEDYVSLVHDPRESSETGRTYTVEFLGNVVGAPPVTYLNVEIDLLRELAMDAIVGGEPVWFGCDTDQMSQEQLGIWDARLFDFDAVYGADLAMPKADRLLHHGSLMTHAMLFVGVDIVEGRPRKWRVENSWGDERGDEGVFTMNDNWFGEHVFEIAVRRDRLPQPLREALDQEPVVLPAWDPMGALAH